MRKPFMVPSTLAIALCAATLVACGDDAATTGLTDPDVQFAKGGKPGGGGDDVLIAATGGVITPDPQPGTVGRSSRRKLFIESSGAISADLNYQAALAAFNNNACVQTGGPRLGLEAFLTDVGPRQVNLSFDRNGTDDNRIFTLGAGGVRVTLNTFQSELPNSTPLTAVFVDDGDGDGVTGTYTYSGGAILMEDFTSGPPKDYPRLFCPNGDDVVITLTRP